MNAEAFQPCPMVAMGAMGLVSKYVNLRKFLSSI
jgi:hypothetical protein